MAVAIAWMALWAALLGPSMSFGAVAEGAEAVESGETQPADTSATTVTGDQIDVDASYTFTVDEANRKIDVTLEIDMRWDKPGVDAGAGSAFAILTWPVALPPDATAVAAHDDNGPLRVERTQSSPVATVYLGRWIFAGRRHGITVVYSLPDGSTTTGGAGSVPAERQSTVVVNEAAAAWNVSPDPEFDRWTAEVRAPTHFTLHQDEEKGLEQAPEWRYLGVDDGIKRWRLNGSHGGESLVALEDDQRMVESTVVVSGHEISVRHWPGDDEWRRTVVAHIAAGLPRLIDLVGRPLPAGNLVVQESVRPLGSGYSGWYAADAHTITIGPVIDETLVLHELSHVWFNYRHFEDRWLIEGLAEEYAQLAVGHDADPSALLSSRHRQPLGAWPADNRSAGADSAGDFGYNSGHVSGVAPHSGLTPTGRTEWAYQGSWLVIRRTRQLLGTEGFAGLTSALLDGQRSYEDPGGDSREPGGRPDERPGWSRRPPRLAGVPGSRHRPRRILPDGRRFDRGRTTSLGRCGSQPRTRRAVRRMGGRWMAGRVRSSRRESPAVRRADASGAGLVDAKRCPGVVAVMAVRRRRCCHGRHRGVPTSGRRATIPPAAHRSRSADVDHVGPRPGVNRSRRGTARRPVGVGRRRTCDTRKPD